MDSTCFTVVFSCLLVAARSELIQPEPYDYCDPRLKLCEVFLDHTMCKYPVAGPSAQCTKGFQEPLSQTEKDKILFLHNKFRSYIAVGAEKNKTRKLPPASNMRQLYWDGELETIAARWADQCTSMTSPVVYDKCRNTKRFRVSQNVGTRRVNGSTIDKQATQIVITWYKETKDFDPALVDKFVPVDGDKVSMKQFTNILWANTYAIGCARVIFQEKVSLTEKEKKPTLWTTERLVCNYGPAGNEIGRPIYKRGAPCENCPGGTECSRFFQGLCAMQNSSKTEEKVAKESVKIETKAHHGNESHPSESSTGISVPKEEVETEEVLQSTKEDQEMDREMDEEEEEDEYNCSRGDCYKNISPNPRNRLTIIRLPRPSGAKYLVRKGVYLNGKCHCSNVQRSRGGRGRHRSPPLAFAFCLLFGSRFINLLSYF